MCKTAEKSVAEGSRYYPTSETLYVMVRINKSVENIVLVTAESNIKPNQQLGIQTEKFLKGENSIRCRLLDLQGKTISQQVQNAKFSFENPQGGKDATVTFFISRLPNTNHAVVEYEVLPGVWQEVYSTSF